MARQLVIKAQRDAHEIHSGATQAIAAMRLQLFDGASSSLRQRISIFGRMFELGQEMGKLAREAAYAKDEGVFDVLVQMQRTQKALARMKDAGPALVRHGKTVPLEWLLAFIGVQEEQVAQLQRFSLDVLGSAKRLSVLLADTTARLGSFLLQIRLEEEGRPPAFVGTVAANEFRSSVDSFARWQQAQFPDLDFRYPGGQQDSVFVPVLDLEVTIGGRQAGYHFQPMKFLNLPSGMGQDHVLGVIISELERLRLLERGASLSYLRSQLSMQDNLEFCLRTPVRSQGEPAQFVRELRASCQVQEGRQCSFTISTAPGGHLRAEIRLPAAKSG